jgi:hypothetical protein
MDESPPLDLSAHETEALKELLRQGEACLAETLG